MTDDRLMAVAYQRAWEKAREITVQRLALLSTAIWAVGALAIYILLLVPLNPRPAWGMVVGLLMLVPAAVPWLAYHRLVATLAKTLAETEYEHLQAQGTLEES